MEEYNNSHDLPKLRGVNVCGDYAIFSHGILASRRPRQSTENALAVKGLSGKKFFCAANYNHSLIAFENFFYNIKMPLMKRLETTNKKR